MAGSILCSPQDMCWMLRWPPALPIRFQWLPVNCFFPASPSSQTVTWPSPISPPGCGIVLWSATCTLTPFSKSGMLINRMSGLAAHSLRAFLSDHIWSPPGVLWCSARTHTAVACGGRRGPRTLHFSFWNRALALAGIEAPIKLAAFLCCFEACMPVHKVYAVRYVASEMPLQFQLKPVGAHL